MTVVAVAMGVVFGCIALALVVGLVDEIRGPASNVRRAGVGVALVAGFASLWFLVTPLRPVPGLACEAPVLVLAESFDPATVASSACVTPMRIYAGLGLLTGIAAPIVVLSTRRRKD